LVTDLPAQVGPVEFGWLGQWVTVHCPTEFSALMRQAGGVWDPGSRRWFIHQRRVALLIRKLKHLTDPLFREADLPG
jgi:hypothetical protein